MGSVRIRLSIMMFLEYAIWGVWAVNLSVYLGGLESFRQDVGFKINMIFLTMAIASILAPFVASRWPTVTFRPSTFWRSVNWSAASSCSGRLLFAFTSVCRRQFRATSFCFGPCWATASSMLRPWR